jgi:hypothetical protein
MNSRPPRADGGQFVRAFFNGRFVELGRDLLRFGEKLSGKTHGNFKLRIFNAD